MARPTPPPRELTYVPLSLLGPDTSFRIRGGGDISSLARSIAQAGQLFPIEVRPQGEGYQAITGFRRLAALKLLHRDRVLVRIHTDISDATAAMIAAADALDNKPMEKEELLELRERYQAMGWSTPALEELIGRAIEKAEERLEDLTAQLAGLPPPDRTIEDEDALDDEEIHGAQTQVDTAAIAPSAAAAPPSATVAPTAPVAASEPPTEPPGPIAIARPRADRPTGVQEAAPRELTPAQLAEELAERLVLLTQDLATIADAWSEVPSALRGLVVDQINYYRQLGAWMEQASGDNQ